MISELAPEQKFHTIVVDQNVSLEDNLEIQLSSLQLHSFPIHYQNFSAREQWKEIIPIGSTNVQIGEQTLYHVNLRAFLYENFRLLEFKTREFRFALSVELFNETFFCREAYIQYDIAENLMNSRLEYIFSLFEKIFQGETIRFQYKNSLSELSIHNELEIIKFQKLSSLLLQYQDKIQNFVSKKEKNFSSLKSSFYDLEVLYHYLAGKEEYDAWINVNFPRQEMEKEDRLRFTRILSYPFPYLPYDLEQTFTLKYPLGELKEEQNIQLNRKNVSVSLRSIDKNNR